MLANQQVQALRQADLLKDKSEYLRVLQRSATSYRVIREILSFMEDLENGTEDPNKVADFLEPNQLTQED